MKVIQDMFYNHALDQASDAYADGCEATCHGQSTPEEMAVLDNKYYLAEGRLEVMGAVLGEVA